MVDINLKLDSSTLQYFCHLLESGWSRFYSIRAVDFLPKELSNWLSSNWISSSSPPLVRPFNLIDWETYCVTRCWCRRWQVEHLRRARSLRRCRCCTASAATRARLQSSRSCRRASLSPTTSACSDPRWRTCSCRSEAFQVNISMVSINKLFQNI